MPAPLAGELGNVCRAQQSLLATIRRPHATFAYRGDLRSGPTQRARLAQVLPYSAHVNPRSSVHLPYPALQGGPMKPARVAFVVFLAACGGSPDVEDTESVSSAITDETVPCVHVVDANDASLRSFCSTGSPGQTCR